MVGMNGPGRNDVNQAFATLFRFVVRNGIKYLNGWAGVKHGLGAAGFEVAKELRSADRTAEDVARKWFMMSRYGVDKLGEHQPPRVTDNFDVERKLLSILQPTGDAGMRRVELAHQVLHELQTDDERVFTTALESLMADGHVLDCGSARRGVVKAAKHIDLSKERHNPHNLISKVADVAAAAGLAAAGHPGAAVLRYLTVMPQDPEQASEVAQLLEKKLDQLLHEIEDYVKALGVDLVSQTIVVATKPTEGRVEES